MSAEGFMRYYSTAGFKILVVVFGLVLTACAMNEARHSPVPDIGSIEGIAVVPFENFSNDQFASEKIRRALISELVSLGLNVVEPGEISRVMRDLEIKNRASINVQAIQALGKELRVPYIILGSVGNYGISKGMAVSYPEISINLMLVDVLSGTILRSVSHAEGGADFWTKHFGVEGMTLSEIESMVVRDSVEMLLKN